jgi:hypothetical protein
VTPYSVVDRYHRSGGTGFLHRQSRKVTVWIGNRICWIYCHVFSDCRRGIGLTIGFIGSRYNYSYRVSQCTPFTTLQ